LRQINRIAQAGLANVFRHAHASRVAIRVSIEDDAAVMEIRDNGFGVDENAVASIGSVGIQEMHKRAQRDRGSVTIRPAVTGGTALPLRVPPASCDGPM